MYKSFKFRLYPNIEQQSELSQYFWATRRLYNYWLWVKISNHQKWITTKRYDIQWQLPQLKKDYPRLKDIHSQVLQVALLNLNTAFTNFFRSKQQFPKFKSKKDNHKSFSYPQWVHIEDWKVYLPKIWRLKVIQHRELIWEIKTCTVSKTPTWKYYISILQDDWKEIPKTIIPTKDKCVGIDVWIKNFAICSNGEVYWNPKWIKRYERRLRIISRRHSRKQKWSENKNKLRLMLASIHEKVSNQRQDYIHKITHSIVSDNQATNYAVEDLNVKGMMANRKLSKAIWHVGRWIFTTLLKNKCSVVWKSVIEIWRFEPSSKICSKCWNIKQDLKLSDRIYKCDSCGLEIDRDLQASINIKNFAHKT